MEGEKETAGKDIMAGKRIKDMAGKKILLRARKKLWREKT